MCADADEEDDLLAFLRNPAINIDAEFMEPQRDAESIREACSFGDASPTIYSGHLCLAREHLSQGCGSN